MRRAVLFAVLIAATAVLVVGVGSAGAYGGDGKMDVYQIGISFNCNNVAFCGSEALGGFWGWAEVDYNPATGAHTGDAQFTGCGHNGQFSYTDEVDTSTFRGQTDVETITNNDTGIPLVPGHYSTSDIFGFTPPPGVAVQLQIAFKPAH